MKKSFASIVILFASVFTFNGNNSSYAMMPVVDPEELIFPLESKIDHEELLSQAKKQQEENTQHMKDTYAKFLEMQRRIYDEFKLDTYDLFIDTRDLVALDDVGNLVVQSGERWSELKLDKSLNLKRTRAFIIHDVNVVKEDGTELALRRIDRAYETKEKFWVEHEDTLDIVAIYSNELLTANQAVSLMLYEYGRIPSMPTKSPFGMWEHAIMKANPLKSFFTENCFTVPDTLINGSDEEISPLYVNQYNHKYVIVFNQDKDGVIHYILLYGESHKFTPAPTPVHIKAEPVAANPVSVTSEGNDDENVVHKALVWLADLFAPEEGEDDSNENATPSEEGFAACNAPA